jgi:2',3'-cyclic-nucleotide 2'-phosphodiesterase (5'-nucleotidase family)
MIMKRTYWMVPAALALCVAPFAISGAMAARNRGQHSAIETIEVDASSDTQTKIGRATADFLNARFDRGETAWGRLVADALRSTAKTDIALVNAGTLESGTLKAGNIGQDDIAALLSFGDDNVATIQISGAQLRQALERAVGAYSTGSPAWLHLSGVSATFNAGAKSGGRITSLRVGGHDVRDSDSFSVAMPISLAEGGSGYYKAWNKAAVNDLGLTLTQAVVNYVRAHHEISPDNTARVNS